MRQRHQKRKGSACSSRACGPAVGHGLHPHTSPPGQVLPDFMDKEAGRPRGGKTFLRSWQSQTQTQQSLVLRPVFSKADHTWDTPVWVTVRSHA